MPDNTCVCCGVIIPEGRHICLRCEHGNEMQTFKPRIRPKPRTNGDKLRSMNNHDAAEFLVYMQLVMRCKDQPCTSDNIRQWLESEVRNGHD